MSEAPDAGREACRKRLPGVHKWLWVHHREWLIAHLPAKKISKGQEVKKALWNSSVQQYKSAKSDDIVSSLQEKSVMDEETAKLVIDAAHRLIVEVEPPKRVTLRRISSRVPQVQKIKQQPHQAPLTMQAIQEAIELPEDFTIRFIQWLIRKHREKTIRLTPGTLRQRIKRNFPQTFHLPAVQQSLEEAAAKLTEYT